MKIIIIGAGQVGRSLASQLSGEANDITLVDVNSEPLHMMQHQHDIQTIVGHGAHPDVLRRAGTENADMLVAVTNSDESNITACQVANHLFSTPRKIARIRARAYLREPALFEKDGFAIDNIFSPELLITEAIQRTIAHPGTLQVLDFANEKVLLAVVAVEAGALLSGSTIERFAHHLNPVELKVVAIYRDNVLLHIKPDLLLRAEDEVFFLCEACHIQTCVSAFRCARMRSKRITIAGGGHIGAELAKQLEHHCRVKLIEKDKTMAVAIAHQLSHTLVLHGDCADKALLVDENIEEADVFCAVTNDDEANIMAALLAKHLGAQRVMALIARSSYVELIEASNIDVVISPQQSTLSGLLSYVRKGDAVKVHALRRGDAEAIELIAHGDTSTSQVVGKPIERIPFPKGCQVAGIVRENKLLIPTPETIIAQDEHVIIFVSDKTQITTIERLFQVGLGFF